MDYISQTKRRQQKKWLTGVICAFIVSIVNLGVMASEAKAAVYLFEVTPTNRAVEECQCAPGATLQCFKIDEVGQDTDRAAAVARKKWYEGANCNQPNKFCNGNNVNNLVDTVRFYPVENQ